MSGTPVTLDLGASRAKASLSGVTATADGRWLWLAPDEDRNIVRLERNATGWGNPVEIAVDDLFGDRIPPGELDLEGIDLVDDNLWFTGSHGRVRSRGRPDDSDGKIVKRLADVETQPSRNTLGRIGLTAGPDDPMPTSGHALLGPGTEHPLREQLRRDPHLDPFVSIPSKDNGVDIEGICVVDDRVLLGLRGPVLRGWAVLVTIRPEADDRGRFDLEKLVGDDRHTCTFVDLGGLGVRDLCRDGDDLLVLTGPTMVLDGPTRIHRIAGARTLPPVIRADRATAVHELTGNPGHPEGITIVPVDDVPQILVVDDGEAGPDGKVEARLVPL